MILFTDYSTAALWIILTEVLPQVLALTDWARALGNIYEASTWTSRLSSWKEEQSKLRA